MGEWKDVMQTNCVRFFVSLVLGVSTLCLAAPGMGQDTALPAKSGFLGALAESLTGDVYSDPT
jgi:hypothetical protein